MSTASIASAWKIGGGRVLFPDGLAPGIVSVANGEIVGEDVHSNPVSDEAGAIDASGLIISPGFIDVQINGGFGNDLKSDPSSMWDLGRSLPESGVTSFLPTLVSSPPEVERAMFAALQDEPAGYLGARPVGLHFEGPMLNPDRSGAHTVDALRPPELGVADGWSREAGVRLVTIAPELPGALGVIRALVAKGVVVAAGHSSASVHEVVAAVEAGLSAVTHLFNAMSALGHRNPNLVGLALTSPSLTTSMIVDGVHVDPIAVQIAWRCIGPDRFVLVTDAVAPMSQPAGEFNFGAGVVVSDGLSVRNGRGTLAGSLLTMPQAIQNLRNFTGCGLAEALRAATANPARMVGEAGRGSVVPGAVADLVLLDEDADANLHVAMTLCAGELAYVAPSHRWRLRQP